MNPATTVLPEKSMTTSVRAFSDADAAAWDAYVQARPRATFFHQTGWKRVLDETFRYRPHYLLAERDGEICGILPLFACRSIKGKMSLYSLPLTVYGGVVGDDEEAEQALLEAAREIGRSVGARKIEFRNRHKTLLDLPILEDGVTFEKELPGTAEAVRGTLPKKSREAVNQATKRHKLECDFAGELDSFYELLAASYLSLGTPVFPKRFFAAMAREFPRDCIIQIIRHEGRPVAAVLSMTFRDTMMPLYSGEASGVKHLKSGNFKYYRLMQEAVGRGLRRFDFGRTRVDNDGVLQFKTNQGFTPEPLPYQIDELVPGSAGGASPNSGLFLKLRGIWRRLPSGVARTVGPKVIRYFP